MSDDLVRKIEAGDELTAAEYATLDAMSRAEYDANMAEEAEHRAEMAELDAASERARATIAALS